MTKAHYEPGRQDRNHRWVWNNYIYDMFHVGYITYLSWLRRDPDYSAYIKRLKAERRADMEARKAERMKSPRRARRTPAQHRVRKVSCETRTDAARRSFRRAVLFSIPKLRKTWSMKRATILTTNENSEKRGQIQNISQQKINTKTPKNAYNLNVGKIVGLNVGKRKLQKAPTNTDYRITKKQYQNSEKRHVFKT